MVKLFSTMKFRIFVALLVAFLLIRCSKTQHKPSLIGNEVDLNVSNDITHLYLKESPENLHLSWYSDINREKIAGFKIDIDTDFSIRVSKQTNQVFVPRKRDLYGKKVIISAILNNNKSIRLDSAVYETNYINFFKSKNQYIAHRGLSTLYPENTSIAFQKAALAGFEYVECDLWLTKDSKWVLIHDETIDRTSNKSGKVSDFTLNELKNFDFGYYKKFGFKYHLKILSLEEFVALCKDYNVKPIVEIKVPEPSTEQLTQLLNVMNSGLKYDGYAVHSLTLPVLNGLRSIDPNVILGYIAYNFYHLKKDILNLYPCFFNVNSSALNLDFPFSDAVKTSLSNFNNTGVYVATWTVNDPKYFQKLRESNFFVITGSIPPDL